MGRRHHRQVQEQPDGTAIDADADGHRQRRSRSSPKPRPPASLPDVQFLFNGIYHMENVWLGYLEPLDGLVAQAVLDKAGSDDDALVYEGKKYRTGFYSIGVRHRLQQGALRRPRLDPDAPPKTWDAFIDACTKLKAAGNIPIGGGVKDGFLGEWYFVNALTQNLDSPADALNLFIGELDWTRPEVPRALGQARGAEEARATSTTTSPRWSSTRASSCSTPARRRCASTRRRRCPNSQKKLGAEKVGFMVMPTFGTRRDGRHADHRHAGLRHPDARRKNHGDGGRSFIDFMHSPERVQAMWTLSKQIPADTTFDARRDRRPADQDGLRQVGRGRPQRLHRRPDADDVLDRRHVRQLAEDPRRRDDRRAGGRPGREVTEKWKQAEPRHGRELHDLGQGPRARMRAVAAAASSRPMLRTRPWVPYLYVAPAVALLVLIFGYPLVRVFDFSTRLHPRASGPYVGLAQLPPRAGRPDVPRRAQAQRAAAARRAGAASRSRSSSRSLLYERVRGWRVYRSVLFMPYILAVPIVGIVASYMFQLNGVVNELLRGGRPRRRWRSTGSAASSWALLTVLIVIVWREVGFGIVLFLARLLSLETSRSRRRGSTAPAGGSACAT